MNELIYRELSFEIIGRCMEVHSILGHGFLEVVYKDALEYEFQRVGIPYCREKKFDIPFKDIILKRNYYADFTIMDKIILEAKALSGLHDEFISTGINYLKVSKYKLCLLINFGMPKLQFKRIVFDPGKHRNIT